MNRSEKENKKRYSENWFVYTKSGCKFCGEAKLFLLGRYFHDPKVTVTFLSGFDKNKKETLEIKKRMKRANKTDFKTWPRIFLNGNFVGGYTDMIKQFGNISVSEILPSGSQGSDCGHGDCERDAGKVGEGRERW